MNTTKFVRPQSEDDFGGPTLVDPPRPRRVAEGTPPPFLALDDIAKVAHDMNPRSMAAIAAANPRALRVRDRGRGSDNNGHVTNEKIASESQRVTAVAAPVAVDDFHGEIVDIVPTAPFERAPLHLDREAIPEPIFETTPEQEWAEFKKIGLVDKKKAASTRAAKLVVSTYRLLGFGILTAIVVALVGYIAMTVFYMFSHTWIVPTVVSANDEKVVAQQRELAAQQNERDRLAGELRAAELSMADEQVFQEKLVVAVQNDLAGRRAALGRVRALATEAAGTRAEIRTASSDFAQASSERMDDEWKAGMIDRHAMLDGKHQLAQISSSNLSIAEKQAELDMQAAQLAHETKALDALIADKDVPLSYDVLKIKRDLDASKLAVTKAIDSRKTLLASLARQDQIIADLKSSPYLRALADHATVALVPYGNLDRAQAGTPLYACSVEMVWCSRVGTVLEVLPGEVQMRHPHRDSVMRGQMVEMRLDRASAAKDDVLFVGGAPLGL